MSVPSGRLQFFALESTDYLERLGLIIGRAAPPDPEELVRLARALRGAALMAGLPSFAQAALAVESLAKTFRDGRTPWTPAHAEILAAAVEELKRLVRQAPDWSDRDTEAAEALARELSGGEPRALLRPKPSDAEPDELKPSVRAFIGREGASIAGTLEHAAQAIELGQPGDTPEVVLQRLQPLRGLASLPSLSPLPEFLDAIELTIHAIREGAPPPRAAPALRQAARAVTRLAREIADTGQAPADAPEVIGGARTLLEAFGSDRDVVEVSSLFVSGDPSPIVRRSDLPPPAEPPDARIERVSLADRFRQAADQLSLATGPAAQTLSLYALTAQLDSLARGARWDRAELTRLLTTVRGAIQSGSAERRIEDFTAALRSAAERLARSAEGRNPVVFAEEFDEIVYALESLQPDDERDVVPIADLLLEEPPVSEPAGLSAFERSFTSYHALLTEERSARHDADVVGIDTLLYRGRRALERADVVRRDLTVALKAERPFREVEPLVSELIDLVPLALAE
jgi:chemotaxis protein histidine kinase CheA